jgi:hypothetical protein
VAGYLSAVEKYVLAVQNSLCKGGSNDRQRVLFRPNILYFLKSVSTVTTIFSDEFQDQVTRQLANNLLQFEFSYTTCGLHILTQIISLKLFIKVYKMFYNSFYKSL